LFGLYLADNLPLIEYANAATGWTLSPEEYLKIGERIQNVRQAFNIRHGLRPIRDFRMNPRAVGNPPLGYGPLKGVTLDRDRLNRDFLKAMQWDEQTSGPTRKKLEALGLHKIAEDLYG
jgi:aldehyde:ferredoxin oxidoreductase